MKPSAYFFILLLFPFAPVFGQRAMSLKDCLQEALSNAYSIQSQQYDNQLNSIRLNVNSSKYLPQIKARFDYFNYPFDIPVYFFPPQEGSIISGGTAQGNYPVPLGLRHNYSLGLSLEQTLLDADFFESKKGKEALTKTNELLEQKAEEDIIYDVGKTYIEILKNADKQNSIEVNRRRLEKAIKIVSIRVRDKSAYQTDLEELELNKKQLETKSAILQAGINKQMDYLKFLLGMDIAEDISISRDSIQLGFDIPDSVFLEQNLNTQLIEQDMEAGELKIKSIQHQKLPELKAYANIMAMSQGDAFSPFSESQYWYNPSTIGLTLEIPIMDGTKNTQEISSYRVEQQKKQLLKVQNEQFVAMSYQSLKADLEINQLVLSEKKINLELQGKINLRKQDMFENELIGISELMDSNALVASAEMEYMDSYYDNLLVKLAVLKMAGKLKTVLLN